MLYSSFLVDNQLLPYQGPTYRRLTANIKTYKVISCNIFTFFENTDIYYIFICAKFCIAIVKFKV